MTLFLDNIRFALTAIWANKLRTLLTMLGIIIGVFSVITLISIGNGVQKEFTGAVDSFGGNVATVIAGDIESDNPASFASLSSLSMDDVETISVVEGVHAVAPLMIVPGGLTPVGREPYLPLVLASNADLATIGDIVATEGRFLDTTDSTATNRSIVVGRDAAARDFDGDPVGQTVSLLGETFAVVGVYETQNTLLGGGDEGSFLSSNGPNIHEAYFIPIETAEGLLEQLNIFRIAIEFEQTDQVAPGVTIIKERILENHKGIKDFTVLTTDEILDLFDQFFGILTNAVAGIAAISLLVGGIGIMNIMLVSVTERTREIGIRKAVGASNASILFQFLVESATVSFAGGAVGFGLSVITAKIITSRFDVPTDISFATVLLALGMSVGIGVLFGLIPATKAARKNPIDALRYE